MSTIEQHKAAVREFTKAFKNEHNVDVVDRLLAPDFKHNFKMQVPRGLEGFKIVGMMNTAFPDVRVVEEFLVADQTKVVETSSASATHLGPMMGRRRRGAVPLERDSHLRRQDCRAFGGVEHVRASCAARNCQDLEAS